MKTFQRFSLMLAAGLALNGSAAANAAPVFHYHARVVDTDGQPIAGAVVERYRNPDLPMSADESVDVQSKKII